MVQGPGVARGAAAVAVDSAAAQPTTVGGVAVLAETAVGVPAPVAEVPADAVEAEVGAPVGEACAVAEDAAAAAVVPTTAGGLAAVRRVGGGTAEVEPAAASVGSAAAGVVAVVARAGRGAAAAQVAVAAAEGVGR